MLDLIISYINFIIFYIFNPLPQPADIFIANTLIFLPQPADFFIANTLIFLSPADRFLQFCEHSVSSKDMSEPIGEFIFWTYNKRRSKIKKSTCLLWKFLPAGVVKVVLLMDTSAGRGKVKQRVCLWKFQSTGISVNYSV